MMKNNFAGFIAAIACLMFSGTHAQDLAKDSIKVQKILKESAKGKKAPALFTITDKEKVAFLSKYIDAKNFEEKSVAEKHKADFENSPGMRYKKGDKTIIPQIVAILKQKDFDALSDLFNQLEIDYFDINKRPLYLDPEIRMALFDLINDTELEHKVIQFIGFNRVDGYISLFENRLLSGVSTDEDRLLFWLSYTGNEKAVDYGVAKIKNDPKAMQDLSWFRGSLNGFFKNGTDDVKAKILNLCYDYMVKNPLTKQDFEEEEFNDYIATPRVAKLNILKFLFENGDKRNLELMAALLRLAEDGSNTALDFSNVIQIQQLRLYPLKEQKEIVLKAIESKEDFFEVATLATQEDSLLKDVDIKNAVFRNFNAFAFQRSYDIERLIGFFPNITRQEFESLVNKYISDKALVQKILKSYDINKQPLSEANDYLYKNGLVSTPVINKADDLERDYEYDDNSIFKSLRYAGIIYNFDVEAGDYPVRHDELLNDFVNISQGKLNGIKAWQQNCFDENDVAVTHLLVVYNNKAYIMMPEDFGDWYDMENFTRLLDAIVADSKIKEQFVSLRTGDQTASYIFGEADKVAKLAEEYNLNNDETMEWLDEE